MAMAATGFTTPTCLASSSSRRPSAAFSTVVSSVTRESFHFKNVRADLRKERVPKVACVVGMAPEDEKMTRRSPLDFPVEWDRPTPGRRPDIFPQFSPMKTPLPPPLPTDPPEEDEEEEDGKKEEDPDKEDKPVE